MSVRLAEDERARLARRAQLRQEQIRWTAIDRLTTPWRALTDWTDRTKAAFAQQVTPFLTGAAHTLIREAAAHARLEAGPATAIPHLTPPPVAPAVEQAFIEARATYAKAKYSADDIGALILAAHEAGLVRLREEVHRGLATVTADAYAATAGPATIGTIRVPQGRTCGFCLAACTRVYKKTELQRLHPGCDCGFRHLYDGDDPERIMGPLLDYYRSLTSEGGELAGLSGNRLTNALKNHRVRLDNDGRPRRDTRNGPGERDPGRPSPTTRDGDGTLDRPTRTGEGDGGGGPPNRPPAAPAAPGPDDVSSAVRGAMERAAVIEPRLTSDVIAAATASRGTNVGLEFKLKVDRPRTETRVRELIQDAARNGVSLTPTEAASRIHDLNRYTVQFPEHRYAEGVAKVLQHLTDNDYTVVAFKNAWGGRYYQGINVRLRTPDGDLFELQFHTPQSFAVKQRTHPWFEIARDPDSTESERR